MSIIIAGHFQLQDEVDRARQALVDAAYPEQHICGFFVNQPGQHDMTAIGGDRALSPGARETPEGLAEGAAAGGIVGAAVGAVTTPVTGPLGAIVGGLVGAHVGSLFSFSKMKDKGEDEAGGGNQDRVRKPGMLLAVAIEDGADEATAVEALRRVGAHHIERAHGTIVDGDWIDFDPLSEPQLLTH
ncbi:glycine zipper domain-containing protein [Massilia sp. DWR3-1-1]|uniref:glycine zipper domain-containing protein n=1 Tax=Massilia sp. DWR3-1-1 TaxID=2804559 RepID=UPI003CF2CEF1